MSELMYHLIQPYKCPACNQEMLFFTTKDNKVIDYKRFISNANTLDETIKYLGKRDIRFIKCIQCGKTYIIDWTDGWPKPLTERKKLKEFGV